MESNDIDVYEASGMGTSTDAVSKGYIVFLPTRGCNKAFYEWLNKSILIPFVVAIKSTLGEEYANYVTWFQLDGEPIQINVYEQDDVIEALNQHNITVGKLPASTTEITQAADQKPFKTCKTNLKGINDSDVEHKVFEMQVLKGILSSHEAKYGPFSAIHRKYFVYGVLRVQMALMLSLRGPLIENSFTDVGIYPFDMLKIASNCKQKISDEMLTDWAPKLKPAAKLLCD